VKCEKLGDLSASAWFHFVGALAAPLPDTSRFVDLEQALTTIVTERIAIEKKWNRFRMSLLFSLL